MSNLEKLQELKLKTEGMLSGLFLKNIELLSEYNIDMTKLSEAGLFYIGLANKLLEKNIVVADELSIANEVELLNLQDTYNLYGGYTTVKELMNTVNENNKESIIDDFEKWNMIERYNTKGILDITRDDIWNKVNKMTTSQLYAYMEHGVNDISISSGIEGLDFENLCLTNEELEEIMSGANIGLQFNSKSPILSGMCLGMPRGELNAVCGYINEGKTSFVFSNFVMPIVDNGNKVLIISTEQRSMVFKMMLVIDVLTTKLKYYHITRKKLKTGKYSEEDLRHVKMAMDYVNKNYKDKITFLKLYDYNTEIVSKAIGKYAQLGYVMTVYDVLKFNDNDEQIWKALISDSKNLFQACSKHNMCGLCTLQLAMSTKNKVRQIGMECVANSKAVFEVMSEAIFIRSAWQDEVDEESPTYLHPYRLKKDSNGKFTGEKEEIKLDKDKHYKIVRLGKSRNDSTDKFILYSVNFDFNQWTEIGMCTVSDKNKY